MDDSGLRSGMSVAQSCIEVRHCGLHFDRACTARVELGLCDRAQPLQFVDVDDGIEVCRDLPHLGLRRKTIDPTAPNLELRRHIRQRCVHDVPLLADPEEVKFALAFA